MFSRTLHRLLALGAPLGLLALALPASGQVVIFDIPLDDGQETPPVMTGASGNATVTLDTATGAVSVTGSYTGFGSNQTLAHIHGPAPAGVPAGILVTLSGTGGTSGSISGSGTLTPAQVADMLAGLHYVNVHSMVNSGGEVRGQICGSAAVATRNSGSNPVSYTCSPLVFGGMMSATVDLSTTGHGFATLIAFDTPVDIGLVGGQRLLCLDISGLGELFTGNGLGPVAGPIANFNALVPNDLALCNFSISTQAIHLGTVTPFALSNAQDLTLGF